MKGEYSHGGYKIIVDFVQNGEVYYRKFKDGEFVGIYRMPEKDFRSELKKNGLEW